MKKLAFIVYPAIVALSLAAAVSAHAQSETMNLAPTGPSASGLTRAQVQAELFKARADGSLKVWAVNYNPLETPTTSRLTRAEVRAEAIAATRSDYISRTYGEGSHAMAGYDVAPVKPVAPVYAGNPKRAQ